MKYLRRISADAIRALSCDLEHGAEGAAVLPGAAGDADEVLPAVFGMWVLAVDAPDAQVRALEGSLDLLLRHQLLALGDLVRPGADPGLRIVGQAGGAVVPVGEAVPAVVERRAVVGIGEGSVQPRAVRGRDGRLQVGPVAAVDVVQVVAVLGRVGGVDVGEGEAVAAQLEGGPTLRALPVFVTAEQMGVITLELIRTAEVILELTTCQAQKGDHNEVSHDFTSFFNDHLTYM